MNFASGINKIYGQPTGTPTAHEIRLVAELESNGQILPAGTVLRIRAINAAGAAAVGADGTIHIIKPTDFEAVAR